MCVLPAKTQMSLSEPELYGALVYKFRKVVGWNHFLINLEK